MSLHSTERLSRSLKYLRRRRMDLPSCPLCDFQPGDVLHLGIHILEKHVKNRFDLSFTWIDSCTRLTSLGRFVLKCQKYLFLGSGCSSVGRMVAVRIQSSAKFILNICLLSTVLKIQKNKEWPGMAHFNKKYCSIKLLRFFLIIILKLALILINLTSL